jgi:hypothetical protein
MTPAARPVNWTAGPRAASVQETEGPAGAGPYRLLLALARRGLGASGVTGWARTLARGAAGMSRCASGFSWRARTLVRCAAGVSGCASGFSWRARSLARCAAGAAALARSAAAVAGCGSALAGRRSGVARCAPGVPGRALSLAGGLSAVRGGGRIALALFALLAGLAALSARGVRLLGRRGNRGSRAGTDRVAVAQVRGEGISRNGDRHERVLLGVRVVTDRHLLRVLKRRSGLTQRR